ncbi:hypothetical protein BS50DRAFT_233703 [Corynespora cassiicola Philippines]|uniref:Uncharacterized protein n=1 Tax=Corynespora cassiicola Philippines TaxID=1448308 RepID=A0A2T2P216_CORCC|nr:hypothetical protein BS50DRAFT_233703 [Corynespora cassiicola Philippines]
MYGLLAPRAGQSLRVMCKTDVPMPTLISRRKKGHGRRYSEGEWAGGRADSGRTTPTVALRAYFRQSSANIEPSARVLYGNCHADSPTHQRPSSAPQPRLYPLPLRLLHRPRHIQTLLPRIPHKQAGSTQQAVVCPQSIPLSERRGGYASQTKPRPPMSPFPTAPVLSPQDE